MHNFGKNFLIWTLTFAILFGVYNFFQGNSLSGGYNNYAFSDFINKVEDGQVATVIIQGKNLEGRLNDGTRFSTFTPDYPDLVNKLKANNVRIEALPMDTKMNSVLGILLSWFPVLLLVGVWIFFMKQMQGGGNKALGFGKSKARLLSEKSKITFDDVAGIDEAKEELKEIVEFLKEPLKFQALGGKIPKGCLLIGQPGMGKTLLAKAIAGEAGVPFFIISGSDFVEMFVGVGASRVRDLFEKAKQKSPCIIFIDEIDAVGRHRGIGFGGGNDEREQTLNQILVEMDGFEPNEGVIVVAATNRPDVLDPALLRPGRFDRQIIVSAPDVNGREQILKVHLNKIPLGPDVDPRVIARGTPGFSGADLANLANEAALLAARRNKKVVTMEELEAAKDKVMMGAERKSLVMSEEEKKLTAYHEGGHALVTVFSPASDPIHKATIIPRGRALGLVMRLPESDRLSITFEKLKADIAVAMGGRVAEEVIFGHEKVTSGASSDIQQATKMARAMVGEWGMSDKIGPVYHGGEQRDQYLGGSQSRNECSTETAEIIDSEVKRLVEQGYTHAKEVIIKHLDKLHLIASALLEFETLTGEEIQDLINGKAIKRGSDSSTDTDAQKPNIKNIFTTPLEDAGSSTTA
ncbi:ATP-dependent zinc metalloprotease FtsH [Rickettsiales endosymbiont of Stachyamoeba lipophora]|uniref:ATP-dependent zinc metalloprotease FtsH n=1 Tax=Rickettsiales endosymbiont of Stachyamoeba lipophora TaxID=2486578 RepID=UPI000F64ABA3|nr:ATP-dependent zinc metalloprotease FtsH [Rickettsiales endosymbiont of Stachyamoeba lipophora]AZL15443.1 ATP-dependent metallopeptidase FtsH/Yme1/Tma family protein [Rickettsiales endosymbiont of Stachyamoeba lipophora]